VSAPTRLTAYAAGVAVLALGAYGVGSAVGPVGADEAPAGHQVHAAATPAPGQTGAAGHDARHGATTAAAEAVGLPAGLQISQDGYTLDPLTKPGRSGVAERFAFRIVGPDGEAVTRFTRTHDKRLHLIVVRRDLTGFQHVHPEMAPDGTWSIPLAFPAAGAYRAFHPDGADDGLTLGADVSVPGTYQPADLPAASRTAKVEGYTVTLAGDLVPGEASKVTLSVAKNGQPVTDLQPYLAAYGHLVALRDGDLAYLHVHPEGGPGDGTTRPGPDVTFFAEVPSTGTYRLFLDFKHDGVVRTAEFTATATPATTTPGSAAPTPAATPASSGGHGDTDHGH
jgi:hypothetical protein